MATEAERERLYDEEIAPTLLALAKKCEELDFSLLALVEWSPGSVGRTMTMRAGFGIEIRMVLMAAKAFGNADVLITQMIRHGKEHGHNSVYLHLLKGAAPTPNEWYEAGLAEKYRWKGPGPAPAKWTAEDGTIVYRSYEDYCDD